jgi:Zn finger protein HypA/HybF involved in hydrogenase expression
MSIQVVCPNGHTLKAQDSLAGKRGLCPVCKAPVKVPQGDKPAVSEDTILDFLGPQGSGQSRSRVEAPSAPLRGVSEGHGPPKKSCGRCNREIPARTHVCPHCHAYIAGLSDL